VASVNQRVSKTTWGLGGLVVALAACAGGPEADDAPSYSDEPMNSTAGAGTTSEAPDDAGGDSTSRGAQAPTGSASAECRLHGPYRLTALGCGNSADYDAGAITGFDAESCSLTVSIDGIHSVHVECEPGDPVTECTGTTTGGSGCSVEWTMYPAE
jgi:hypothetical protein